MGIFDWDNYKNGPGPVSANDPLSWVNPYSWGTSLGERITGSQGNGWTNSTVGYLGAAGAAYGGYSAFGGGAAGGAGGAAGSGAAATTGSAAAGGSGAGLGSYALIGGGGLLNYLGQQQANSANAQQARDQMAFQERMSSTAHQRETTDLKLAGLNPLLSANGGASSPSGAAAVMQNDMAAASDSANKMVETRLEATRMQMQAQQNAAQRALMGAQFQNTVADTKKKEAERRALGTDAVKGDLWETMYDMAKKAWDEHARSNAPSKDTLKFMEKFREKQRNNNPTQKVY